MSALGRGSWVENLILATQNVRTPEVEHKCGGLTLISLLIRHPGNGSRGIGDFGGHAVVFLLMVVIRVSV